MPRLSKVHNVFHVSVLRNYINDLSHIFDYQPIQIQNLEDMLHKELSVKIIDRKGQVLKTKLFN